MKINDAGLALIKEFEGLSLDAYPDPGTGNIPYTIGYGHTGGIMMGMTITEEQATDFLMQDIASTETAVSNFIKSVSLNENQFSALVSFAYNVGTWRSSTLFKMVLLNKPNDAAEQFQYWNHAAGRVLDGLTRRRAAEKALFLAQAM